MSKHDLQLRPIYHRERELIDAHLTVVFAALAVCSSKRPLGGRSRTSSRPPGRHRTIQIDPGGHTITAEQRMPGDLRATLDKIHIHR